ncbi:MAG: DMT family transporter [Anaerolineales bacterium]
MSQKLSARWIAYLELTGAIIIWGASFVATKIVLKDIPPIMVIWIRFGMGVIFLGAAMGVRHQWALPSRRDWAYFALTGFLGITFHQWLQSTALQTTEAATSAWIVATSPIFMALFGWLGLREAFKPLMLLGLILATLGLIGVVSKGDWGQFGLARFGSWGDLLMLISAANWALFSALSKPGLQKYPPTQMMFLVMAWGWLFTTILLVISHSWHPEYHISWQGWVSLIFLGVFCSGLAYLFWYDGLQSVAVVQVGAFLYFEPLVTVVVAGLLLKEKITWVSILGGAMILIGVWLVNRVENNPKTLLQDEKQVT